MRNYLFIILTLFLLLGCSSKNEELLKVKPTEKTENLTKIKKTPFDYLNGFYEDDLDLALKVFKKACTKSKRKEQFKEVCENSLDFTDGKEFFTKNFTPKVLVSSTGDKGLITGYYEPLLYGSKVKSDLYKYPIYKTPKDLVIIKNKKKYPSFKNLRYRAKIKNKRYVPYDTREQIEKRDDLEVICYVEDKIDLFFLQVQGSGRVLLDNGELINVGYANQNGRKYKSIGKKLIEDGYLEKEEVTLQTIKAFLLENPKKVDEILNYNPSYIFFTQKDQTATGSLNVPLVAKRNIAVDRRYIPLGMPVFLETSNPKTNESINKLVIAADTGGAIKGEIRADYFLGYGDEAMELAGLMKEEGRLFMLIPNDVVD